MMNDLSIIIVGVGGQGTLLTSRVLGSVALKSGYDVKISEVHGMAQRGGSVVTYVRMGRDVSSPVIDKKSADIMLAFEMLEAMRWMEYIKKDGILILNTQRIDPMPVIMRKAQYPDDALSHLKDAAENIVSIDALKIATGLGNRKVVNIVMLGTLAKHLKLDHDIFIESIHENVPARFLDINIKAFEKGYE